MSDAPSDIRCEFTGCQNQPYSRLNWTTTHTGSRWNSAILCCKHGREVFDRINPSLKVGGGLLVIQGVGENPFVAHGSPYTPGDD